MKNQNIFWFGIMIVCVLGFCALPAQAKYGGGRGTATEPYLIDTAEHMNILGGEPADWGRHFKLTADIDFDGPTAAQFNFIGYGVNPYSGVFDGNGHSIHNFEPLDSCASYMSGLFGKISSKGEVRNLTLVNPRIQCLNSSDYYYGGLLVGGLYGRVTNCHVIGGYIEKYFPPWPRSTTYGNIGGLVGSMDKDAVVSECSVTDTSIRGDAAGGVLGGDCWGTIQGCTIINIDIKGGWYTGGIVARVLGAVEQCSATGIIRAEGYAGGIVGVVSGGPADSPFYPTVRECYASCSVSSNDNAGGLAGAAANKCLIIDCYATGSVGGQAHTGGLVSCLRNYHGVAPQVINCYAAASLSGSNRGGLINHTHLDGGPVEVVNSFWDVEASGVSYSACGTGKTTAQMKTKDTFTTAGWDFTTPIWKMCNRPVYPRLYWEECPAPRQIYVDADATGANDGSTWADAFSYLQDALSVVWPGDEIRVAQGIYTPAGYIPPPPPLPPPPLGGSNEDESIEPAADRTATFQLKNGVVIKGGYAGFGEPDPNERDIELYETILSGDLAGNDGPDFANNYDNSYHVMTGSGCDETAVLDGFTITAGNDDRMDGYYPIGHGSGMLNEYGTPAVSNCTFTGNYASDSGGGIFNGESSPTLFNCTFIGNSAGGWAGGGMFNWTSSPVVTNCTFVNNSSKEWGGAICNYEASSPTLSNCIFRNNSTTMWGGAICNVKASSPMLSKCIFSRNSAGAGGGIYDFQVCWPTLTNCIFTGNSAIGENGVGGGLCNNDICYPTLTNCTFAENKAGRYGGAIANYKNTTTILTNCILWDGGDEIYSSGGSVTMITYSDVQGGWPGEGNIDADPCFVEPEYLGPIAYWKFDENSGTTAYDSVSLHHGTVYGAQWTSGQVGSALDFDGMDDYVDILYDSSLDIDASEGITLSVWVKLNSYPDSTHQGPIFGLFDSTGQGTKNYLAIGKSIYGNVIAWDQWPPSGGGITSIKPDLDTWYHVAAVEDSTHKAIYINGSLDVSDTTLETYEGNLPDTIRIGCRADDWAPFYFDGTIDEVVVYNIVLTEDEIQQHYQSGLSGQGYPPVPDYHLQQTSACINAADNNSLPADTQDLDNDGNTTEPIPFDIEGNPRIVYDIVDMGAFEFVNTPPIADAGPDQIIECACNTAEGTKVTLDGTNSSDPDYGVLTYTWTGPFVEGPVHGATPTVTLDGGCPGEYVITLFVNDVIDDSEPNEVVIKVVDTTPPDFTFSVTPTMLWPPDHKMVEITPSWTVSDECDQTPDVSLVSIVANEGDDTIGDGHTTDDIQIGKDGSIYLRSERSGTGDDRVYTITYQAVDDCGNTTVRSAAVSIPHDFKVLAKIAARWLWSGPAGRIPEDLNGDGVVNLADFARFAGNWTR